MSLEEAADQALSATKLDLELAAAHAYWTWVSAGQGREVAQGLLQLAEERDAQLRRRLQAGSIAEFDVVDNERILLERRAWLVAAERAFEKAVFGLSLFLRDSTGAPVVASAALLPDRVAVEPVQEIAVERAVDARELRGHARVADHEESCTGRVDEQARAELEATKIGQRLTKNGLAPELKAVFEYSRDLGELTQTNLDFTLPGNVFEAGVQISMPLLLRKERGRAGAARAEVAEKHAKLRFVADQLRARTRDAASAVEAAQARAALTEEVVETAAELAEGERRRFEVGSSNLIFVNLREQQAAMARMRYIEAVALAEIERTRWETTTRVECVARVQ